jgi:septum site-determining protein MinC
MDTITTPQPPPPIRIKGVGGSLWVTLDPETPLDILQEGLRQRFEQMKNLAENARVIIDTGSPEAHRGLVTQLGDFLKAAFPVASVAAPPQASPQAPPTVDSAPRIRQRDMSRAWQHHRSDVLMLTGRVRSGQKVTARKHLLILGDVNPGGEVVAGGDILVIGSLCGTASAGQPDNLDAIVLALDFRPTQVQIGGFVAAGLPDSPGKIAEFAHLENGAIMVEDYLKAAPFGRLPWPQVR